MIDYALLMSLASLLIMSALLAAGGTATSSASPAATVGSKPKQAAAARTPKPIDPAIVRLPPDFKTPDFERVIGLYTPNPRGEFETATAYRARLAAVPVGKYYAFNCQLENEFAYDIDSEEWAFTLATLRVSTAGMTIAGGISTERGPKPWAIAIGGKTLEDASESRTNAFGAQVKVRVRKDLFYVLALQDGAFDSWLDVGTAASARAGNANFRFSMSVADAKAAKGRLRAIVVARPATPSGAEGPSFSHFAAADATFNKPYDTMMMTSGLWVDMVDVLVFDTRSGEVLFRASEDAR